MNYDHEQVSVKKPKDDADLSSEEAKEWLKCANDIEYFLSNYVWTQGQRGRVLFKPRKYQTRFYDAVYNNDYVCLLSGRQSGKCICKDTKYTVRNKRTGETYDITAEEFHELVSSETFV